MSYINWNIAKESIGRKKYTETACRIFYRDGTGDTKSVSYVLTFYEGNAPDEILLSEKISVGSDGENIYISTRAKRGAQQFNIIPPSADKNRTYNVNCKSLIEKIIKTMTGVTPKGDFTGAFDLKLVGEDVYRIIDFKIK